uniref:butyrophilin subfamily 1 member A1-like n=1 Tax=Euleptes europaea TaxID=460621 RepID=UPI002540C670|nr:butyrophilin subfamily 1 member A1-like [Euleptes europaea]
MTPRERLPGRRCGLCRHPDTGGRLHRRPSPVLPRQWPATNIQAVTPALGYNSNEEKCQLLTIKEHLEEIYDNANEEKCQLLTIKGQLLVDKKLREARSNAEHFEISSSPSVLGTVGQDVILPCQISLGRQPQSMEVQWQKIGDNNYVNIYQFKAPSGLETFGQGYKSRTMMTKEGLPNGNVSLKLKNVQVTDEGTYRCIVKSTGWSDNTQTVLYVAGMGMVSIEILGPEGEGIKLACRSSGWFPRPELQWLVEDTQNHPFELEQDHEQLFSVFSSITVLRSTREVTCLVHDKSHLQLKQKSTIFLSREDKVIAPQEFFEICQKDRQKALLESVLLLKAILTPSLSISESAQTELDFRKAKHYLVPVHLDPHCKHPELALSEDRSKVQHNLTSSKAAASPGALIVVGTERFKQGRQYWQVGVWDKPDWELGVLTETTRDKLKKQKFDPPPEEGYWSLRKSNGKYHFEEADRKICGHSVEPQVVGVYLDWEGHTVSFYSVNSTTAIWKTPIETSEKLYPFFSPGHSKVGDEVKPLIICHNSDWDFPSQLGQQNFLLSSSNDEKANTRVTENSQESGITINKLRMIKYTLK